MQERCRRREHILRSSALRQAKGPTIHEGDHGDGSVDVADAIYCHCLLQIILRLRVRIGRGALLKIVLASKLPDLCIDLSRRKPQNEYHYQSESKQGYVLQLRYSTLVSPASLSRFRTNLRQLRHIGRDATRNSSAHMVGLSRVRGCFVIRLAERPGLFGKPIHSRLHELSLNLKNLWEILGLAQSAATSHVSFRSAWTLRALRPDLTPLLGTATLASATEPMSTATALA